MNRSDKSEIVADLVDRFNRSSSVYATDFTGLTVKAITDFRNKLREVGVEYVVVKNTLASRAIEEASVEGLDEALKGSTGWVFMPDDPVGAAKVLKDFQKEFEDKPAVKAGLLEGKPVGAKEVEHLASLPGREQLLAQLGGALQSPLQAFVGTTNGLLYQMAGLMESLRTQRSEAA